MGAGRSFARPGRVALLQFTKVSLKAAKPSSLHIEPITLGDKIRHKRMRDGLTQKQAAQIIGVDAFTLLNWEKSKTTPSPKDWPGLIRFLGYVPQPEPASLADRLCYVRCIRGWSLKEAGHAADIHEETWGYWEGGQNLPPTENEDEDRSVSRIDHWLYAQQRRLAHLKERPPGAPFLRRNIC